MRARTITAVYVLAVVVALALPTAGGCIQEARLDPGACAENEALCDGRCVDVRSSHDNCAACGNACGDGEVCDLGECASSCSGGFTACDGTCVDARFDPDHCGSCGNVCDADLLCSQGQCASSCTGGTTECNGLCVATDLDPSNCGDCGVVCDAGMVCSQGVCSLDCGGGTVKCGTVCTNTDFDPAHCGACDNACPGAANAAATCSNSACDISCNTDFGNCDGSNGNGCEIDLRITVDHCADCTIDCPAVANGARGCSDSTCGIESCDAGWDDCDTLLSSGCETRTDFDVTHCGGCNSPCGAGDFCVSGGCTGSVLFAADGRWGQAGSLYIVDPATAEAIPIQTLANPYTALQYVSGTLYGLTQSGALFIINPLTGGEALVGDVSIISQRPRDLALRPDGTFLSCNQWNYMVQVDRFSAVGTQLADSTYCDFGTGFAEAADGTIYQLTYNALYTVGTTGTLAHLGDHNFNGGFKGVTFHNGTLYAVNSWDQTLVTVDVESLVVNEVGSLGTQVLHGMTSTSP